MAKSRSTPSAPLFESAQPATDDASRPLADRLRPNTLGEVVGQDHLLGEGGPLRRIAEGEAPRSMILWGPPGAGKTTIARLLASRAGPAFRAALGGVLRRRRPAQSLRGGPRPPPLRPGHAAVRRRNPPLQPRPAGRLPALCRGRHHHPDRRHDRKPVLRAERRAAVALPGAGAAPPRRRGAGAAAGARRRRLRAATCR